MVDLLERNLVISNFIRNSRSAKLLSITDVAAAADLSLEEAMSIEEMPVATPLCDLARYIDAIDYRLGGTLSLLISSIKIDGLNDKPIFPDA